MGMKEKQKSRAPRNRTLSVEAGEIPRLKKSLISAARLNPAHRNRIVQGDFESALEGITDRSVDLLFLDPPYNLHKDFGGWTFKERSINDYGVYLDEVIGALVPKLKSTATVYICGDWKTSVSIPSIAGKYFRIRNRITWEREKGRGARTNWKNCSEDIWFCTVSDRYTFHPDRVRLRRKVLAPYRDGAGAPKDWETGAEGSFRDTAPSNLWTDITIPFWSMPENTDHPTQKSEKLLAKLILASSDPGQLVLDPFLGSGTTAVVCRKLERDFLGIERHPDYCLIAQKRLIHARPGGPIQGLEGGIFKERNSR
jgi:site-specific DNA-methyltransferase (adenine-specific)